MRRTLHRAGRERDAQAARTALLDAAQAIFACDGFSGARVDDIASRAGYNKALIFHYFDDKLGLYRALMLRTKGDLFARIEQAFDRFFTAEGKPADDELSSDERARTLVTECVSALFDLYAERPEMVRILAWEAAEGWQAFLSCAPVTTPGSQRMLALVERAQAAGAVRADLDPQLLITTLISLPLIHLISLPRFAAVFPASDFTSPDAIAHAREQLTEFLLRGILAPAHDHAVTPAAPSTAHAGLASATQPAGDTGDTDDTEEC